MMQKIIDGNRHTWQNNCVALNQAIRFSSLNNVASKPPFEFPNAQSIREPNAAFLTLAFPQFYLFTGNRGGRLRACWYHVASLLTRLLFPALRLAARKRAYQTNVKR